MSSVPVYCLATQGSALWACSGLGGFLAGVSIDDGATFAAKLARTDIQGALACGADASAAQCTATNQSYNPPYDPFLSLCSLLEGCSADAATPLGSACEDAGACPSGDSSASSGSAGSSASGGGSAGEERSDAGGRGTVGGPSCGCSAVGGEGAMGAVVAAGALTLLTHRRRRRWLPPG
jgi:MYXO-CTERM domain-containing protein